MPIVRINGERAEAKMGETLLGAARQSGSHIWFLCDGRGICLTCECRVLAGGEHLNPATELETSALGAARRESGYRLACQTRLTGNGEVSVISSAEKLRRQLIGIFVPSEGVGRMKSAGDLLTSSFDVATGLIGNVPHAARHGVPQLSKSPPTVERAAAYARDTFRLFRRMLPGLGL
jgi:ferredoxin